MKQILFSLLFSSLTIFGAIAAPPDSDPEKAFAELKIVQPSGHPWRVAQEDWDGARYRVEHDPEWGRWLVRQRKGVDDWMERHHDRTEWICGWWHDFVSPKDGSFITWEDSIPGEQAKTLRSPSDPAIAITPKIMGGWIYVFRGKHSGKMVEAARLYRLTGETKYRDWVLEQLDFYAQHFTDWPVSTRKDGARLYWQTLDEAMNLVKYAECVRLLGDAASPERKQMWWTRFFQPETEMLNRTLLIIHNIATWHRCASAKVAMVYGNEELWKQSIDSEFGLRRQLALGVTGDYIWWEQSLGYNSFLVRAVETLFTSAGVMGRAGELEREMAVTENLMLSVLALRFPDGYLPTPADTTGLIAVPNRELFRLVYRIFPTPIGLKEVAGEKSWDTLLDPPAPAPASFELPEVTSRNLESTRMALLKTGKWQLYFHYGQLTASHAQSEGLNFEAYYGDTPITHDPGTVGYGSPLHKGYYTRGLNHNVPLIDGEGQGSKPQPGTLLDYSAEKSTVSAELPLYQKGILARRKLSIRDGNLVDEVVVEASDTKSHRLGLSLHVQGKVKLPDSMKDDAGWTEGRPDPFRYWKMVKAGTFTDEASFEVICGKLPMRVTFRCPGTFQVWHGDTPDAPPRRREGFYLETSGTHATFETTIEPLTR